MTCPHCGQDVIYRERSNHTCGKCKQRFAVEPKFAPLGAHDVRLAKAATALSAGGTVRYTEGQLLWRLARGKLETPLGRGGRVLVTFVLLLAFGIPLAAAVHPYAGAVGAGLILVFTLPWIVFARGARLKLPDGTTPNRIVADVVTPWVRLYGGPPQGFVPASDALANLRTAQAPEGARALVVSHDQQVLACLAANDVPARLGVELASVSAGGEFGPGSAGAHAAAAAPDVPVLVLRDASVAGQQLVAALQSRVGTLRVVDVGLTPAQARRTPKLVRTQGPGAKVDASLAPDPEDRAWLAAGNHVALAAVPPPRLIAMIERAVVGAAISAATDDERAAVRLVGFV